MNKPTPKRKISFNNVSPDALHAIVAQAQSINPDQAEEHEADGHNLKPAKNKKIDSVDYIAELEREEEFTE
ncbi:MAG: hypothetical protein UX44_C0012G0014 [candidate division WWE3 bacterium GW2011_GWA1_46_21]|uniref:Uncharacterized protein n=2 Tax=Katanobacteria TaxID=422282 RepID=A0A0G1PDD4_UNCKA|nr:MAG: hypothetical protein UX44_C0012G0014 [candidate division WWE3 bacterium GW2011_GWA1_46_21]KKU50338.1 MAG: hypothetical protein UX73_C0022G0005 [candidate division WWE3 bacterium GW2011_GWC1_47_10]